MTTVNAASHDHAERGARLVTAGIIVSRVFGLVRNKLFNHFFGSSVQSDAYNAASRIPNVLRNLLGEGAISASFVPVYAAALERGDDRGARALANALLGVLLAGTAALTLLGIATAPWLTTVFTHGFDPARAALTTKLLRILFPMTGLMVLSGWCLGVQNANRRFFTAYASAALWSIAQIALLIVAGPRTPDLTALVWWVSWATLVGAALQIGAQAPQVWRLLGSVRPTLDTSAPGLRETLVNFVPVVSALGLFQISSFIDIQIASYLPVGALTNLTNANQLYLLPLSLFGVATAAAALPELARHSARGDGGAVAVGLARAWERVLFYTIPSAAACIGVGDCMIALLYGGGRYGLEQQSIARLALAAYALGLVAYASSRVVASTYQATRNYRTPFVSAAVAIAVSAAAATALAIPFRDRAVAVAGIAVGSALGAHVNLVLLWRGLRGQLGAVDLSGPGRVARGALTAAGAALIPSLALRFALRDAPTQVVALLVLPLFCAVFLWVGRRLGLEEAGRLVASMRAWTGSQ